MTDFCQAASKKGKGKKGKKGKGKEKKPDAIELYQNSVAEFSSR